MSKQSYLTRLFYAFFPKPLELQLVEACEAVPGLRKRGENDILEFKYLMIVDLANALREELFQRGITIIPHDLECTEGIVSTPDGDFHEARVKTEFIISNGHRQLKLCSYGSSRSQDGFAVSAAQTFALKALLKRLSMIFGDDDDPELPRWAHVPETSHQQRRQKDYQKRALADAINNSGKTVAEIESLISEAVGKTLTSEQIADFPVEAFEQVMGLVLQHSDLSNVLQMSVDAKKGPQTAA